MNPELEWGALQKAAPSRSGSRRGFQEVPPERRGFWHGVMTLKLKLQELEDDFSGYHCECGECAGDLIDDFDDARLHFQPGHVRARADHWWRGHRGFRFGGKQLGPDDPENIIVIDPDCNRSEFWKRVWE